MTAGGGSAEGKGSVKAEPESAKALVAFHEAGHAVVAELAGGPGKPYRASIKRRGDRDGHIAVAFGRRSLVRLNGKPNIPAVIGAMQYLLAGTIAEYMAGEDAGAQLLTSGSSDMAGATRLGMMLCGNDEEECAQMVRWLTLRTGRQLREWWPSVEAVAAALLERGKLNRQELAAAIEGGPRT